MKEAIETKNLEHSRIVIRAVCLIFCKIINLKKLLGPKFNIVGQFLPQYTKT
jgi:hypothetical protein